VSATAARFAGKRVNAQEFDLPDHALGEDRVARYARAVLQRLWWLGAVGASWWCFTDYPALVLVGDRMEAHQRPSCWRPECSRPVRVKNPDSRLSGL